MGAFQLLDGAVDLVNLGLVCQAQLKPRDAFFEIVLFDFEIVLVVVPRDRAEVEEGPVCADGPRCG